MSLTLEAIAERVVWWKPPAQTLADQRYFPAHVMTSGTFDEVRCVRGHFPPEAFRAVLEDPPAGVFDPRSWAYWNLMFDREAPERILAADRKMSVSRLVGELLREKMLGEQSYEVVMREYLARPARKRRGTAARDPRRADLYGG